MQSELLVYSLTLTKAESSSSERRIFCQEESDFTNIRKTDGQLTLISAVGSKKCKKAMPVCIRLNGLEKMQIQILIYYTKWNQCLNSNDSFLFILELSMVT